MGLHSGLTVCGLDSVQNVFTHFPSVGCDGVGDGDGDGGGDGDG